MGSVSRARRDASSDRAGGRRRARHALWAVLAVLAVGFAATAQDGGPRYDLMIVDGLVYDGLGTRPRAADLAIQGDRIAAIGDLDPRDAAHTIDAEGLAVAPGFINMLSWATHSLIEDGRALSDLAQGITLEVFGEGWSMGPLNDRLKASIVARQSDIRFDVTWDSLGGYLEMLERRGVAPNVASFVGATTVRRHVIGDADRAPTPAELDAMRALVDQAMREGAMGVGASLIYAPAFYADTDELIALVEVAVRHGGSYISHLRSEGDRLLEALDELIAIAEATGAGAEVYHLKAAGRANWPKLDQAIARIEAARARGLDIRANIYTYTAGATGLDAAMPPWVQEGGHDAWVARLKDPETRARVIADMRAPSADWENLYRATGDPEKVLFAGFRNPDLKPLTGKTLAEVMAARGTSAEDTMIDLVIEDDSRVSTIYFMMSPDNLDKKIALPWVAFGSDAGAPAPDGVFLQSATHPRAYGNVARLLGRYVRERGLIPLEEAIRRLTSMPAANLKIADRGRLAPGAFADVVVFDPDRIVDRASYANPHRLATGVLHVLVNGTVAFRDGLPTGALPGRVVRGPGWLGRTAPSPDDHDG
ncbi:aminoacylase [Rhodothalassium salexigens]|uniref:N-acyl-D-amino-acid deacylase family protein n=1 Tax=Rhodothalassium salexigens TaxID=1086 RepID=UPI001911FBB0|nr:D-aminoacylase [Rhodothalassium salexigens]MBK5910412.1 aminoacylase [Rhodothalassium salexigens]